MNGDGQQRYDRQQRRRRECDGTGQGRGRRGAGPRCENSLSRRTATRAVVAVGAYVAQDLRDAEGVTRPLLRRTALRLALSRREAARRLGGAYLRLDPLVPGEGRQPGDAIEVGGASPSRELPAPPVAARPGAGTEPEAS